MSFPPRLQGSTCGDLRLVARRSHSRRAFTLIELLLALALLTMLVTALLTFVFSMGEIWGRGGEKRLFEQHVNAVTRHVESMLRRASWPRGGVGAAEPFAVREVRPQSGPTANLLGFDLLDGDRLLEWPEQPLPEVRCHLAIERERGLVIYWQSLLEQDVDEKPPRLAVVSPLVTQLAYAYQDPNSGFWRTEQVLRKNNTNEWLLPDRLILTFKQGSFEATRELTLPPGGSPPVF
jgi:prepilin-type N-terminal cleavage/methylation domain-containing protein